MAKQILVTGASGFLGTHLARFFSSEGEWEVLALPGRKELHSAPRAELTADWIVHAGFSVDFSPRKEEGERKSENLRSIHKILEIADQPRTRGVLFLSAAGVLGVSAEPRARNEACFGLTDPGFEAYRNTRYIQDKLEAERLLREGLTCPLAVLYLSTVYGKGMSAETLGFLQRVAGWNPISVVPPGGTSLLGLDDFLQAVLVAVRAENSGRYVVSGANETYASLVAKAARCAGVERRKKIVTLPGEARKAFHWVGKARAGKLLSTAVLESSFGFKYYSAESIGRDLGWRPMQSPERIMAELL